MIKPLAGFVLISPIEDEGKSAGGVYLPESTKDKPSKGKVIAINLPHTMKSDLLGEFDNNIKVNDVVIYKKWTNQEVDHEGKKYLLVKFDELLGIIE